MNYNGIIIGVSAFLIIGLFHPLVIKGEYYFGVKVWPVFLISGILCCVVSIFLSNVVLSSITGVIGFSCFWSILEIFHQRKRVEKGWYPENPKRKNNDIE